MGLIPFNHARRIDADTIGLYTNDLTKLLQLDKATANQTTIEGQGISGDNVQISANTIDTYPKLVLNGLAEIDLMVPAGQNVRVMTGGSAKMLFSDAYIFLYETSTPTAKANYGAIYTKNDNKLYFQDGAGTEHTLAFV